MKAVLDPPAAPNTSPAAAATPEKPAGRHRSGSTESGVNAHQFTCVLGVLALVVVLVLLVLGALAKFDADTERSDAQAESSQIGGRLVSLRAETHDTGMHAARYFDAWRTYVEAARRYGAASAVSAEADAVTGATLAETTRRGERQEALSEADGPLRDLETARLALAEARTKVEAAWAGLVRAGVLAGTPNMSAGEPAVPAPGGDGAP